jgi:NadR type nicotinamide-nucleotide adenylyltransferase
MTRVVLTGGECTGKTTLARQLARSHGAAWVPEHAREYLNALARPLGYGDVEPIARGQIAAEDSAAKAAPRLLILDTDLVSTVVYSRYYYGDCPAWIVTAARERLADIYLLHHPDVPWVADGLQRDLPQRRGEMHALFEDALKAFGARSVDIRGGWDERRALAAGALTALGYPPSAGLADRRQ